MEEFSCEKNFLASNLLTSFVVSTHQAKGHVKHLSRIRNDDVAPGMAWRESKETWTLT